MASFDYVGAKKAGLSDQQIEQSIQIHTGKKFDVTGAVKSGLTPDKISSSINQHIMDTHSQIQPTPQQQGAIQGPANSFIDNTLGKIPGVGGLVGGFTKGIVDPAAQMAEQSLQESQSGPNLGTLGGLVGLNVPTGTKTMLGMNKAPNQFQSSQDYQSATSSNPVTRAVGTVVPQAETAFNVITGMEAPGLVKGAAGLVKGGAGLLKGGVESLSKVGEIAKGMAQAPTIGKQIAKQVEGAARGADVTFKDFSKRVTDGVSSKELPAFQQAVQKTLGRIEPGMLGQGKDVVPSLSSKELLSWRQQLDTELRSFWKNPSGATDAEIRAKAAVRDVLGQMLHENAPGTKLADKLLSLSNKGGKLGGSPIKVLGKYSIPAILGILGAEKLGGLIGGK